MKLFFETESQPFFFLLTLPLGFFLCFFLDLENIPFIIRLVLDLIVLVCCGICLVLFVLLSRDQALRLYHLLGLVCGALLYLGGIGKIRQGICARVQKTKAGNAFDHGEIL